MVISSLPYGHADLFYIEQFKKYLHPRTLEKLIKFQEYNLIRYEQGILERNKRMRIINLVLLQQPIFYKRGSLKRLQFQISNNTGDFLLLSLWQRI